MPTYVWRRAIPVIGRGLRRLGTRGRDLEVATAAYDDALGRLESCAALAQAALAESERADARTHALLETARDAYIAMDADAIVTGWNAAAERTFGWSREEAVGRAVTDLVVPPELHDAFRATFVQSLHGERQRFLGADIETLASGKDRAPFPVLVTSWLSEHDRAPTLHSFVRDISRQKRAQADVARYAAIVAASDEAIFSTDLTGAVLTWNPGAERIYGWARTDALGRCVFELLGQPLDSALASAHEAARRCGPQRVEVTCRTRNGTPIEVDVTLSPIVGGEGEPEGIALVARDMTEQRWVSRQLDATLEALQVALAEARDAETRTRRFLDDAAHQLRRPLTSIQACTEMLSWDLAPDDRDRLLAAVLRESARAGRLTSQLLRMARADHDGGVHRRCIDLAALCEQEAEVIGVEASALDIRVVVDGGHVHAAVDPDATAEILANLLDNARRFARRQISIRVSSTPGVASIAVTDDGPGLPAGACERVFERFVTLDPNGGAGLGLPIARELARAHGGDVVYDGAAFVVTLARHEHGRGDGHP